MKNVFSWRNAIQESDLEPTTRLVLFNLSLHMNEQGRSCYPTVDTQARETGLSRRAVITHLDRASDAGFIIKKPMGLAGQKWKNNQYIAAYPQCFDLLRVAPSETDIQPKAGEPDALPLLEGGERDDMKAVNVLHPNTTSNSTEDINKKTKTKKGTKITLAQWEEKKGAALCVEMMAAWCKENGLDVERVKKVIPEFRERMQSGENLYANFVATFQVWLRNGYLTLKFEQAKQKTISSQGDVKIVERGLSL